MLEQLRREESDFLKLLHRTLVNTPRLVTSAQSHNNNNYNNYNNNNSGHVTGHVTTPPI